MPTSLRVILIVYLALAGLWAVYVPPFEKPDEIAHFAYAQFMATRLRIPRQAANEHPFIEGETQQPPLYYVLVGVPYRLATALGMPLTDLARWQLNPRYYARQSDGKGEMAFFEPMDGQGQPPVPPVPPVPPDLLLVRICSLLMGAGVVWLAHRIALRVFPGSTWLPLVVAGGIATLPQFTFLASGTTNDNLAFLWGAAGLGMMLSAQRLPAERVTRAAVGWGVFLGLAVYVKATLFMFGPLAALTLLSARTTWRHRALAAALLVGVAVAIGAPWFARNLLLYHDLFGRQEVIDPAAFAWNVDPKALWSPYFWPGGPFWQLLGWSAVGLFGMMDVRMPDLYYGAWAEVFAAGVFGGGLGWLYGWDRRLGSRVDRPDRTPLDVRREVQVDRRALAWLGAALALALAALVHYNLTVTQPQGRYLFHVLPADAVLLVAALAGWAAPLDRLTGGRWRAWTGRWGRVLFAAWLAGMVAVNLWALFAVVAPAYGTTNLP